MFSDRALLGPTGRRTYSTRETPALRAREWVLKKVGQKGGVRKNTGKEKSIVVRQNLIILLLLRHLVVPPTFLSGSTPLPAAPHVRKTSVTGGTRGAKSAVIRQARRRRRSSHAATLNLRPLSRVDLSPPSHIGEYLPVVGRRGSGTVAAERDTSVTSTVSSALLPSDEPQPHHIGHHWQTPLCSKCLVGFFLCS